MFRKKNPLACEAGKCEGTSDKLVTGIVIGGAVGALLGIFFAPKSGRKNRERAMKLAEAGIEKGRELGEEIIAETAPLFHDLAETAKPKARGFFARTREAIRSAREK